MNDYFIYANADVNTKTSWFTCFLITSPDIQTNQAYV